MSVRILWAAAFAGLLTATVPAADPLPPKPLTPAEVEGFIRQLGDENYNTREKATEALKRRPEAALALLRANRAAVSPEVRRRLATILPVMMSKPAAEKRLARLFEYVKNRQVDRLVETMAACREFVTLEQRFMAIEFARWQFFEATKPMLKGVVKEMPEPRLHLPHPSLALRLIPDDATAGQVNGRLEPIWQVPRFNNKEGVQDDVDITEDSIVYNAAGSSGDRLVIAADCFEDTGGANGGIMIGNGELRIGGLADGRLIITTGNVIATGELGSKNVTGCVVLCGGDFKICGWLNKSVVMAGGDITYVNNLGSKENVCRERDTELIGTWKLYSTSEAGVTLGSWLGVVWVRAVAADGPFAKAGIRPGDVLASIDGTPIRRLRDANRLLCRAIVSWGAADLTVVRDDKKRDGIVTLCEW